MTIKQAKRKMPDKSPGGSWQTKVPLGCVLPKGIHSCPIDKDKCLAASYCYKLRAGLETLEL